MSGGRDRQSPPCCDCCKEEIEAGAACYELPDGFLICAESDCLAEWAAFYRRRSLHEEEKE